jgi:RNA polymerase sigma-70 factor (ECF subfamily)
VEDQATAEDILQAAYLNAIERGSEIRDEESTVAWFYRILRNAVTDHYRCRAARAKVFEAFSNETPEIYKAEIKAIVCKCIGDVIGDLKPEYRMAMEQVSLGGTTVEEFAESEKILLNNASVRLDRSRKALA